MIVKADSALIYYSDLTRTSIVSMIVSREDFDRLPGLAYRSRQSTKTLQTCWAKELGENVIAYTLAPAPTVAESEVIISESIAL